MAYASGDCYNGEWKDDEEHGKGTMAWTNGDVYEGKWKDGLRHGTGIECTQMEMFTRVNGRAARSTVPAQ
ncbi:hypothetical protein ACHAXR_005913 [Thalassiosira sp. AJA248-18]